MNTVNIWAVVVASVVAFGIGAIWYSPILFGKEWMSLLKITDHDMLEAKAKGGMWKYYLAQLIATIVMFTVLGFAVTSMGIVSSSDGAFTGFLAWLGLVLPVSLSGILWKREPGKLFLIEVVNTLITLVIGGAILGGWQ